MAAVNERGRSAWGPSLALGYFDNAELTAKAFVQNP